VLGVSVTRERVVCVVPVGRIDAGEPLVGTGGLGGGGSDWVVADIWFDWGDAFDALSYARILYV